MRFLYVFFGTGNENVSYILYNRMASCIFFHGMNYEYNVYAIFCFYKKFEITLIFCK